MGIIDEAMTANRLSTAQQHVYNVCRSGHDVILIKAATVDEFGERLTEETLTLKSFPVRFSPFDRELKEKISWAEKVDIIFYISMKEVSSFEIDIEDIKQYTKIRFNDKTYSFAYAEPFLSFYNNFLYVVIGGKK